MGFQDQGYKIRKILLPRFLKLEMQFYVLFISLLRSICLMRFLANVTFSSPKSRIRQEPSVPKGNY